MGQQTKGFLGWAAIKKTAGNASNPTVNTVYSFPIAAINPRNPNNISYPTVINADGALSVKVAGKKTPSVALRNIPLKSSFFGSTGNVFLQSIIGGATGYLDSSSNSDEYAIGVNNGNSTRVYDGGKCSQVSFYQTAPGGPVLMDQDWLCIYGDSEKGSPTSISTPSTDAGTLFDITKVSFNSTLDQVYSWRLTLMRPQAYQFEADSTLYSDTLQSGMIGGTFSYVTSPLSSTVPGAAGSVTIQIGAAAAGVQIVCNVNQDEIAEDVVTGLGTRSITYTLINSSTGAYPVTVTAL